MSLVRGARRRAGDIRDDRHVKGAIASCLLAMLLVGAAGWASAQPNLRAPMDSPLVSKLLDEPFTRPEGEIRAAIEALRFSHNTGEAALLDQAGRRRLGTLLPASIAIAVAASIP